MVQPDSECDETQLDGDACVDPEGGTTPSVEPKEGAASSAEPDMEPEPYERRSVIDAVADLLQFIIDWLRQEAGSIMREKVVLPAQRLGLTLASGFAAGCLAVLGITYISVAAFILLAQWITYPGALLLIGGVLVLGSVIFTVIKMRSVQK